MLSSLYGDLGARRRVLAKPVAAALGVWLGVGLGSAAHAEISDTIHPFVGVTRSYDANLLRYSDSAQVPEDQRSDSLTQTQFGVNLERPIGRQKLSGQFKVSKVAFDRYDMLDYTGRDFNAELEWHVGNHLDGRLGGSYARSLTSFSDFHQAARNLQVQQREFFDGGWRFHPDWRVRAGWSTQKFRYDLPAQQFNNRTEDGENIGLDYLANSGSRIGLQVGRATGRYDNHFLAGGVPIDDGYTQDEVKLNVQWLFSGTSQFQMLAGRVDRKHSYFAQRDSSGFNGRATFNWSMLRRLRMTATAWREYSAVDSNEVSNSFNKGGSLNAQWELTGKISADLTARRERRDFIELPGVTSFIKMDDDTKSYSAGLNYLPLPSLRLYLGGFRDTRKGSQNNSFHAHGVSFSARVQF